MFYIVEESSNNHKSDSKHWWIIGGLGVGFALIIAVVALFVCLRSSSDGQRNHLKDPKHERVAHKFHILKTSSFWCGSGRHCCKSNDWEQTIEESSDRHTNIPKGLDSGLCYFYAFMF